MKRTTRKKRSVIKEFDGFIGAKRREIPIFRSLRRKKLNLPSRGATLNWSSSTLRSGKNINVYNKRPKKITSFRGGVLNTHNNMTCSPLVKGKQVIKNSCYTADSLKKIKIYYNKKNPSNPITTTDPVELWKTLKTRLVKCQDKPEDCWLNTIEDQKLKSEIDEDIFAPDSPPEWTKNPNEWLSNFDISNVLKQYEEAHPEFTYIEPSPIDFDKKPKNYQGSCVSNELCKFSLKRYINKGKTKIGFIFNLDEHTKGGSHWVSMFVDLEDKFIFYFNSTGEAIPREIEILKDRILEQAKKENIELVFIQNHPTSHQRGNNECGMYSLFFIISMISDLPLTTSETSKQSIDGLHSQSTENEYSSTLQPEEFLNEKKHTYKNIGRGNLTEPLHKNNKIIKLRKIQFFKDSGKITDKKMNEYRKKYFNIPTKSLMDSS